MYIKLNNARKNKMIWSAVSTVAKVTPTGHSCIGVKVIIRRSMFQVHVSLKYLF